MLYNSTYQNANVVHILYPHIKPYFAEKWVHLQKVPNRLAYPLVASQLHPTTLVEQIFIPQWERQITAAGHGFDDLGKQETENLLPLYYKETQHLSPETNSAKAFLNYTIDSMKLSHIAGVDRSRQSLKEHGLMEAFTTIREELENKVGVLDPLYNSAIPFSGTVGGLTQRRLTVDVVKFGMDCLLDTLVQGFLFTPEFGEEQINFYSQKLEVHFSAMKHLETLIKADPSLLLPLPLAVPDMEGVAVL